MQPLYNQALFESVGGRLFFLMFLHTIFFSSSDANLHREKAYAAATAHKTTADRANYIIHSPDSKRSAARIDTFYKRIGYTTLCRRRRRRRRNIL